MVAFYTSTYVMFIVITPTLTSAHRISAITVPAPINGKSVLMALAQRARNTVRTMAPRTHQAGDPIGPKNVNKC